MTTTLTTALALVSGPLVTLSAQSPAEAAPTLTVTRVVGGLHIPWDITWVGQRMLFDQRAGGLWSKRGSEPPKRVSMALPPSYAHGEAGMLGLVADPGAATNNLFYTCMAVASKTGTALDVEVLKWRLTPDNHALKVAKMVTGIPLNGTSTSGGRHSGCRLRFRSAHMLYIGTGDAARGTNAQNLQSLGGKILRVRDDGQIPRTNPFYGRGGNARYVWSYGRRNVQGLVLRPGTTQLWSVEHGPARDDEVNRVWKGHNYGWNPVPGYNESRPMTDLVRFPNATRAKWRSGYPTVATSGGAFLTGARWGSWNGALAVGMLKGQGILVLTVDRTDRVSGTTVALRSRYGRIRTVQQGPDGAVYFTTSNGSADGIYQVTSG